MEKIRNGAIGKKKRAVANPARAQAVKPCRVTLLTRVDQHIYAMVWHLAQERGKPMSRINDEAILFYFEHLNSNI